MDAKRMSYSNRTSEIQVQQFSSPLSPPRAADRSDCEVIMIMTMEISV